GGRIHGKKISPYLMKKVAMIIGPKIAPTLILKRILMKEILSQYHQTLTNHSSDCSSREADPEEGYESGVPKEEEAISEAGRNVKESQLALAEEKEVESEAERNVTELEAHSINFSGHNKATAAYQEWEDNLKIWYHRHQPSDEEADDEPVDTWKDFRLEMMRFIEEAEKDTAAQYHQLQRNDTLSAYTHTSTLDFKNRSKKADHPHSPQKVETAKEKLTIKQARNSQPSSLQLP
ncbi:unnamed protein product, partial [Brassica rapa subsp. trilocularis]